MSLFRKKKYVHCPECIGKRKCHALVLSSTQVYELKSLCEQHLAGFQTKEIYWTGAVFGALSLYYFFYRRPILCTFQIAVDF